MTQQECIAPVSISVALKTRVCCHSAAQWPLMEMTRAVKPIHGFYQVSVGQRKTTK